MDDAKAAWDLAIANEKAVNDKIARITAIMKHMKDTNDNNKGTIKDITTAKDNQNTLINAADGL